MMKKRLGRCDWYRCIKEDIKEFHIIQDGLFITKVTLISATSGGWLHWLTPSFEHRET
jgi:hypothetical protein